VSENLGKAVLELEVDGSGFSRGMDQARSKADSTGGGIGRAFGKVGKMAALGLAGAAIAVAGGIALVAKTGISEIAESQKVTAQTNAVITSTGKAARVSAKEVESLASAISMKTGVDDEAIQAGENMLLTFTNVRNEAGKGNDIFTQSTRVMTDFAVAMGKDPKDAALMLGKALNDPAAGMNKLQRAGVTFTQSQKDAVAAMQASGDMAGAQKIILAELNKEFGGSAEALGKTLPGQIQIAKIQFEELSARIMSALIPAFTTILTWVNAHWPQIEAVIRTVVQGITTAIGFLVSMIGAAWPHIIAAGQAAVAWYQGTLQPAIQNVVTVLTALWKRFGDDITTVFKTAFTVITTVVKNAMTILKSVIELALALIRGDWSAAWNALKTIVKAALDSVVAILRGLVTIFLTAAKALGSAVLDGIQAGLAALATKIKSKLQDGVNAVTGMVGAFLSAASAIGRQIVDGIVNGAGGLFGRLKDKLESQLKGVLSSLNPFSPVEHGGQIYIGEPIVEGAIAGIQSRMGALSAALEGNIRGSLSAMPEPAAAAASSSSSGHGPLFGDVHVGNTNDIEVLAQRVKRLLAFGS
jgi:hypothetical protein